MKFKKLISLFITVMLIVGTVSAVSAASFPDLEARHSWAEDAIKNMTNRGILKGYTDGTFKPDRAVTHMETLIIASRIMGVDEDENEEYREVALKKYASVLSSYDITYKAEVAYLLYTGVLSTDELSNYISNSTKNEPLKRYEAAVLLTKLVGGEEEALSNSVIVLDFDDANSIPGSSKAYVKYVSDKGLMNGMEDNKFVPSGELTRAMISTVMYRAEEFMDESTVEGTVQSTESDSITLSVKGVSKIINVPDGVDIKVDGKSTDISKLSVGQYIRAHYQGGTLRYIDAVTSNLYLTVTGTISSMAEESGSKKIILRTSAGSQSYIISPDGCKYLVNNKISTYSDIKTGMYATITVQGGYITEMSVETGSKKITGKLVEIIVSSNDVIAVIEQKDGTEAEYIFNDGAKIIRNDSTADFRSLAEGDSVTITLTEGGIESLIATSSSSSVSGTIGKILISSSSEITIKTANAENVYSITSDTKFTVDGKSDCTIYDLRLGASADVRLDGTKVKSITTQSLVVAPTMTGVITYVHPTGYAMGLQVVDASNGTVSEVQTVVKSTVKITDTTSSRITAFKNLEPGMTVVVVGTSNYGVYEVNQIIVTATVD